MKNVTDVTFCHSTSNCINNNPTVLLTVTNTVLRQIDTGMTIQELKSVFCMLCHVLSRKTNKLLHSLFLPGSCRQTKSLL